MSTEAIAAEQKKEISQLRTENETLGESVICATGKEQDAAKANQILQDQVKEYETTKLNVKALLISFEEDYNWAFQLYLNTSDMWDKKCSRVHELEAQQARDKEDMIKLERENEKYREIEKIVKRDADRC